MTAVAKVTALITRLGANGRELCVFDHPTADLADSATLNADQQPWLEVATALSIGSTIRAARG